jgi:hypothetical protein
MNTNHVTELPSATLDAIRTYADQRHQSLQLARAAVLRAKDEPLTNDDRATLLVALQWWREQQSAAADRVQEITARLSRP